MEEVMDVAHVICPDDAVGMLPSSDPTTVHMTVPILYDKVDSNLYPHQEEGFFDNSDDIQRRLMELRYEVLDNNSQGIYLTQCQEYDAAEKLLVDTFNKIVQVEKNVILFKNRRDDNKNIWRANSATGINSNAAHDHNEEDVTVEARDVKDSDGYSIEIQLLDQLKSATLTNVSFVVYHKGMLRDALAHLESSQELDAKYGVKSPVSFINLCVVLNAIGNYSLATQHALQAIDILRQTAVSCSNMQNSAQQSDERMKLWGAAWHNLAISQLQLADPTDKMENSNIVLMFENSMAATNELLGYMHPMSRAITETYRIVRKELRSRGAYFPHYQFKTTTSVSMINRLHSFSSREALTTSLGGNSNDGTLHLSAYTGKMLKPPTINASKRIEDKQMSVVLRSKENIKYVEKIDTEPYDVPPVSPAQYSNIVPTSTRELGVYQRGVDEAKRRAELKQIIQENQKTTRHLTRGEPVMSPTAYLGSVRAPRPPSQRDRRQCSARTRKVYNLVRSGSSGIPLSGNLALAAKLYSNPHPLTQMVSPRRCMSTRRRKSESSQTGGDNHHRNDVTYPKDGRGSSYRRPFNTEVNEHVGRLPPIQSLPKRVLKPQHESYTFSGDGTRDVNKAGDGRKSTLQSRATTNNNITNNSRYTVASPKRCISDLLMGDMWVEAPVMHPRNSPSVGKNYYKHDHPARGHYCSYLASREYSQAVYSLDPADRVVEPFHYSHPDSGLRIRSSNLNDDSHDLTVTNHEFIK